MKTTFYYIVLAAAWVFVLIVLVRGSFWVVRAWESSSGIVLKASDPGQFYDPMPFSELVRSREQMLNEGVLSQRLTHWRFHLLPEFPAPQLFDWNFSRQKNGVFGDFDVKLVGIDVKVVQGFFEWLSHLAKPTVSMALSQQPEGMLLVIKATFRSQTETWKLLEESKDASSIALLVDRGLIHTGRWMRDKRQRQKPMQHQSTIEQFPNAESETFYRQGMLALTSYFESRDNQNLTNALDWFQQLHASLPDNRTATFLLGLVESEARHEEQAISLFSEVIENKQADSLGDSKQLEYHAELLRATSKVKVYRWREAIEARSSLLELASKLESEIDSLDEMLGDRTDETNSLANVPRKDREQYKKRRQTYRVILANAYTQAARAVAHLVPILRHADDGEVTRDSESIFGLAPDSDRGVLLAAIHSEFKRLCKLAKTASVRIENSQKAVKREIELRREVDANYLKYRLAEWFPKSQDAAFVKDAKSAERSLASATISSSRDYSILQNRAAILSDPRFRGYEDRSLAAMELWNRSLEIKPDDYWGYQSRARLRLLMVLDETIEAEAVMPDIRNDIDRSERLRGSGANWGLRLTNRIVENFEVEEAARAELSKTHLGRVARSKALWLQIAGRLSLEDWDGVMIALDSLIEQADENERLPWIQAERDEIVIALKEKLARGTLSEASARQFASRIIATVI